MGQPRTFSVIAENDRFRVHSGHHFVPPGGPVLAKTGHLRLIETTTLAHYDAFGWEPSTESMTDIRGRRGVRRSHDIAGCPAVLVYDCITIQLPRRQNEPPPRHLAAHSFVARSRNLTGQWTWIYN
jgi:hypothetical protein